MNMKKQPALQYCFQQDQGSDVHKLYIYDDVTEYGGFNWNTWEYEESETSAKYFRDQLELIPETDIIELHINSRGGSVKEGVAIYNQLKQHKAHKKGYVDGVAYSIAFVILQACDERIMGLGTSALIHNMWVETWGNAKQLRKEADDLDILSESNRKIFMARAKNITEEELMEKMDAETYLTPDECVDFGFCDKVEENTGKEQRLQAEASNKELLNTIKQLQNKITMQQSFTEQLKQLHGQQEGQKQDLTALDVLPKDEQPVNRFRELFEKAAKTFNQ